MSESKYKYVEDFINYLKDNNPLKRFDVRREHEKFWEQINFGILEIERSNNDNHKKWLKSKLYEIENVKCDTEEDIFQAKKTISSNLGEIKAFGLLYRSFLGKNLICSFSNGSDFSSTIKSQGENYKICIEVNTPLAGDDEGKTTLDLENSKHSWGNFQMKEVAPFGLPQRKSIDSVTSEAISKIAAIKKEEKQFEDNTINILWVDFVNPFLSELDLLESHEKPFIIFNNDIFTGNIWWAMYGKKRHQVLVRANGFSEPETYKMEYNGRLQQNTKIDFVIFNMKNGISIFEKMNNHKTKIPEDFYKGLFTFAARQEYSKMWINYPVNNLKEKVDNVQQECDAFITRYKYKKYINSPLISVIIPCYNAEKYVEQAVRSIMEQTYKNLEILCTDDCSIDSTLSILERLAIEDSRIRIIRHTENKKLIFTLNELVQESKGDYIARMDADDISLPERLEKQFVFLQNNLDISFCGTNAWHINEAGKKIGKSCLPLTPEDNKFFLPFYSTFYHPTVMVRAEVFKKNQYSPDFVHAEDYELWCRLVFERGIKGANLKAKLFEYRMNSQGVSAQNRQTQNNTGAKVFDTINILNSIDNKEHKNIFWLHNNNDTKTLTYAKKVKKSLLRQRSKYVLEAYKKLLFWVYKFQNRKVFFSFLLNRTGLKAFYKIIFRR